MPNLHMRSEPNEQEAIVNYSVLRMQKSNILVVSAFLHVLNENNEP